MTDITCTYTGDREETLIAYLYDDIDPAERAAFAAHVQTCARCRTDLQALGGVREHLARWNPPVPNLTINPQSALRHAQGVLRLSKDAIRNPHWWNAVPVWAQVAAALLFLGVSAGIANLDVRYDRSGLTVRTGWRAPKPAAESAARAAAASGVTHDELVALEERLRSQMRSQPASATEPRTVSDDNRIRSLIAESEKRQRNELVMRIAEVLRGVEAERQADLVNIDRNLDVLRNGTLTVDQRQRALMNYVTRVSQQK
ncbi:MAG TPA: zf-HC2 domain-containing protein [Vicinamibacterales bacterium]|jgi:hypothetical protein